MTGRQQEAAMHWIAERCGQGDRQLTCPACGRTGGKWGLCEDMVCMPFWSKERMDIERALLAVVLTCAECGYMLLFCAKDMGLV